ncbi:MAG: TetR/AcrR family transcriptional regulator [Bacteroidales bacterium]
MKGNKKYESILEESRRLFWKHGFRRVTVEEICREANTSKMTFYRYFPNKLEVAKAVFDRVVESGMLAFRDILEEESSAADKMRKLLLMKLEGVHDVSKEFLSDFYGSPELGLKDHIEVKTRQVWQGMLEDFRKAQQKGIFRKDLNFEFFFYVSQKQTELIHDTYLQSLFPTAEELVMEFANLSVYGIAPRDQNKEGLKDPDR